MSRGWRPHRTPHTAMLRRDGGLTRARGAIFGNPVATGATVTCFMAVVLACVAFAPSTSSRARARSTSGEFWCPLWCD